MSTDESEKNIHALIAKSAEARDSADAMRFAQAATNAAQAMGVLAHMHSHLEKRDGTV